MSKKLTFIFILNITLSCGIQTDNRTTILLEAEEKKEFPYKDADIWKPKSGDIKTIDSVLEIAFLSNKTEFGINDTITLDDYYKQLVPFINDKGERIVYVNSLCVSFIASPPPWNENKEMDWNNHFYNVDDGGTCFWQTKINMDTLEYFDFTVNGF